VGLFFFYGTLRDRSLLSSVLGEIPIRSAGEGTVRGALYDAGDYPALVLEGDCAVPGELIEVADFEAAARRLDVYEAVHQGLYSRRRARVDNHGETVLAWVYVYEGPTEGKRQIECWPRKRAEHEATDSEATGRAPQRRPRFTSQEGRMVEKSIELTGISTSSIEEAVRLAVARAAVTIDSLRKAEVIDVSADLEDGEVVSWRVRTRITFAILDRLHE